MTNAREVASEGLFFNGFRWDEGGTAEGREVCLGGKGVACYSVVVLSFYFLHLCVF